MLHGSVVLNFCAVHIESSAGAPWESTHCTVRVRLPPPHWALQSPHWDTSHEYEWHAAVLHGVEVGSCGSVHCEPSEEVQVAWRVATPPPQVALQALQSE